MDTSAAPLELYGYWRSNATYRVRVAMNLKGVPYREIPVDLDAGAQHEPAFLVRNPQGAVPALMAGEGEALTQSLAILDYLEERYPEPPILPRDALGRARVRALACNVACDIHPLLVPRVRRYVTGPMGQDAAVFRDWLAHWVGHGLEGLEANLAGSPHTGSFCHGESVTMADICLAGLVMIPRLFGLAVPETPTVTRIAERCFALDAFAAADPRRQADAPRQD